MTIHSKEACKRPAKTRFRQIYILCIGASTFSIPKMRASFACRISSPRAPIPSTRLNAFLVSFCNTTTMTDFLRDRVRESVRASVIRLRLSPVGDPRDLEGAVRTDSSTKRPCVDSGLCYKS